MPEITSIEEIKYIREFGKRHDIEFGLHCLKSSLFSPEGPQKEMLEKYFFVSEFLNSNYFSDHIAISHINDTYLSSVHPITYTTKNLDIFNNNLREVSKYFPRNFYIENITQNKLLDGSEMSESDFINELNQEILFDITNMYITCKRNSIKFEDYLKNFPFEKVKVLHISGLTIDDKGIYHDVHSENLNSEILSVLSNLREELKNLEYVLIERDFNVNSKEDILNDLMSVREIFE